MESEWQHPEEKKCRAAKTFIFHDNATASFKSVSVSMQIQSN